VPRCAPSWRHGQLVPRAPQDCRSATINDHRSALPRNRPRVDHRPVDGVVGVAGQRRRGGLSGAGEFGVKAVVAVRPAETVTERRSINRLSIEHLSSGPVISLTWPNIKRYKPRGFSDLGKHRETTAIGEGSTIMTTHALAMTPRCPVFALFLSRNGGWACRVRIRVTPGLGPFRCRVWPREPRGTLSRPTRLMSRPVTTCAGRLRAVRYVHNVRNVQGGRWR